MVYERLQVTSEKGIASIVLDNPATLNGLDMLMATELEKALDECENNNEIKVVVLSGAGRAFCGGGDIRFMFENAKKLDFAEKVMDPLVKQVAKIVLKIKKLSKPVISSVLGAAAGGGCNLAFGCDFVFAAENAKFLQAFVGIALTPDTGGAYFLTRTIGTHRALDMFITGRVVSAEEAYNLGLVKEICTVEDLKDKTMAFAAKLANGPSLSYKNIKRLVFESEYADFEKFIQVEMDTQNECAKSEDFFEGISAFLEKRKPVFKGK